MIIYELFADMMIAAKPQLNIIQRYARVEMAPPTFSDIPAARNSIMKIVHSAKTGAYKQLTVREAWLNTLVTIEVLCWFFVGECIGKRHIVGYDV